MRILLLQSDGKHKGQDGWTPNYYLRECYAIKYALEILGHKVDIWGLGHDNYPYMPEDIYNILWLIEQYEFDWVPQLNKRFKNAIRLQWIIDLHYQKSEVYEKYTQQCDFILHSTRKLIEAYARKFPNQKHIWFPNGVDSKYFNGTGLQSEKKSDLIFVGQLHDTRKEFIYKLEKEMGLGYYFLTGIDMIQKIAGTRINFNKNISDDINYRTFETIGIGTCLLTNYDPELELLGFKDRKNCLIYNSYEKCVEQITWALDTGKWKDIAIDGFELSKSNTYIERCKNMLKEIYG